MSKLEKVKPDSALPAAMMDQFQKDAGKGLDTAKSDDFAIPFLKLIQGLSPERQKSDPKYIPGAEEGLIFNSVTMELFSEVRVIPVYFEKMYNEWKPRNSGGGLVALNHDKDLAYKNLQPGNLIVDTANYYVLFEDGTGEWRPAIISCTSTKLKISRAWNSRMQMITVTGGGGAKFNPPTYSRWYTMKTQSMKNDKGTFYVPEFADGDWVTAPLYKAAAEFREAIVAGKVQVRHDASEEAATEEF